MANYPTIVRKFQPHSDGTEFVLAGHMNDVQNEVMAIESTLGVKPNVYSASASQTLPYPSVAARLDQMQHTDADQEAQIQGLLDASRNGWSLPLIYLLASGTSIAPTVNPAHSADSDWHPLRWTDRVVDTEGIYSPGFNITIPKSGWWILTSTVGMLDPTDSVIVDHYLWARVRAVTASTVRMAGGTPTNVDLAQGDSSAQGLAAGYHRITMAVSSHFHAGDTLQVQLRHSFRPTNIGQPNPPQTAMSAYSRTQLTFIRGMPPFFPSPVIFPWEVGS